MYSNIIKDLTGFRETLTGQPLSYSHASFMESDSMKPVKSVVLNKTPQGQPAA
jgi:hypothetical protein